MKLGDLVFPILDEEFMFSSPEMVDYGFNHALFFWYSNQPGVILEKKLLKKDLFSIKVLVGNKVGWTYSDYVEINIHEESYGQKKV